jgi:hypothetical protein
MHGENLRNPARERRAGAMREFPSGQLDSTLTLPRFLCSVQKQIENSLLTEFSSKLG